MKKLGTMFFMIIVVIFVTLTLMNIYPKNNSVEPGIYSHGEIDDVNYSFLILHPENKFAFLRGLAYSYIPHGDYEIDGENLLLKDGINFAYKFKIKGDRWIYLTDDLKYNMEYKFVEPKDYEDIHTSFIEITKNFIRNE